MEVERKEGEVKIVMEGKMGKENGKAREVIRSRFEDKEKEE